MGVMGSGTAESRSRPGGRAARVRAAVFDAALVLLSEPDWSQLTRARVADRAGVHHSTVHRHWPSLGHLVSEAIDERLAETSPLPDTGSFAGDIRAHARRIADDLTGPGGQLLIRAAALAGPVGRHPQGPGQGHGLAGRTRQVAVMFDRARDRGEPTGSLQDYFEYVGGPLYGYARRGAPLWFPKPHLCALSGSVDVCERRRGDHQPCPARRSRYRGGGCRRPPRPRRRWRPAGGLDEAWLILARGLGELAAVLWFWVSEPSVAHQTGYRVSPFEWEVAVANLATLVGVVIAVRHRGWRVPVATFSLGFLLNAVAGHLYQALAHGDHTAGNTFGICIGDIVIPAVGPHSGATPGGPSSY
jgi:AcrR family transcriptional regulator